MKTIVVAAVLYCAWAGVVLAQERKPNDLEKMEQIVRVATVGLQRGDLRVVFASEDSRDSMRFHHWIVTVVPYPADYKAMDDVKTAIVFTAPPCSGPANEFCSIRDIPGEPAFRGRFDTDVMGHLHRFDGSIASTASKVIAFHHQLEAHPQWTQADVAAALASAGAKYGPDKEREFAATKPWNTLQQAFGPMRLREFVSLPPVLVGWPAYWRVTTILLREPKTRLVMYFDPFEGQLQQLFISQPLRTWDPKTKTFKWKYLGE